MNTKLMLQLVLPYFPNAKLYGEQNELILIPKINLYFLTENVTNKLEFDCKMIEWLSRPAHKGMSIYWQSYILRGLNSYFKRTWSKEDMSQIYTKLGNSVNRALCIRFIESGFDMSILNEVTK